MSLARRRPRRLVPALILAILGCLAVGRPASAQWGWGWGGWGMRGGGFLSNAATLRNLNNRSSQAARYAYSQRGGLGSQATGRDSYVNHTRDASFGERFSVSSRRTLGSEAARLPASAGAEAGDREPVRRVRPLEEYFTASGALAWPGGAPEDGPLGSRRAAADSAVTAVYREVKASGRAPVASVSDARAALVAYGQPALDELRAQATPAVVDGFHRFLLGLYDSLGQAALEPSARRD